MPDTAHPNAPEQRTVDVDVHQLDTRGRTLHGYAAVYGAESGDLGGFRERIAPGAFASVLDSDVRCLLNHDPSQVLGRTRSGTLRLADEARGLRFEADLPDSPLGENVRAAVARGDIDGASFRFRCGRESWEGETRTVEEVAELHDVTIATYGAYPSASVELRTRPEPDTDTTNGPEGRTEDPMNTEDRNTAPEGENTSTSGGGLAVEDRAAEQPTAEQRVMDELRSVNRGESRALSVSANSEVAPADVQTVLFDRLRPASVMLQAGVRVVTTERSEVTWPQLVTDVAPDFYAELEPIAAGDPGFQTLTATPRKLAHRIEASNEVIDDSDPSIVEVLTGHLAAALGLKLDSALFEGNPAGNPDSIRGLKFVAGIQMIASAANGGALTNYDKIIQAVGLLAAANVPGPYVAAMNPRTATALALLKDADGRQLAPPAGMPQMLVTTQLSVAETKGTAIAASSVYVFAPAQLVLVRRQDAAIELDRSRLFNIDASELRGKLRADLLAPNPSAVVRIDGVIPA